MNYTMLRDVYICDFERRESHPGVCNKLMTVYVERHPLMISLSLSSTLASIKHILQDVNRKEQNNTCKQPFEGGCHPGVCNKLVTVYKATYPLMISSSLSSTLSSVKHILQDVNRKALNRTCKQLFKGVVTEKQVDSQNSYLSHLYLYILLWHTKETRNILTWRYILSK